MATPRFLATLPSGEIDLDLSDGGMSGDLAAEGNTVTWSAESIASRAIEAAPSGMVFNARRTTGLVPRQVTWACRLKGASTAPEGTNAALTRIEQQLDQLTYSGAAGLLSDSAGNLFPGTVLMEARRLGRRITTASGMALQHYLLVFELLRNDQVTAGVA